MTFMNRSPDSTDMVPAWIQASRWRRRCSHRTAVDGLMGFLLVVVGAGAMAVQAHADALFLAAR